VTDARTQVLDDLAAEGDALDALLADQPDHVWSTATPAQGWTVADQVGHLTWTDEVATLAASDAEAFAEAMEAMLTERGLAAVDDEAHARAALPPGELLARWRTGRAGMVEVLREVPEGVKLPWFGPPMSATSMGTARLMETWAHGQDVVDALGVEREPTARLRHVAHIAVRTRDFAHVLRDLEPPAQEFRVELTAPDGGTWSWGPPDAAQRVEGTALDFCLLAVQRRHRDDVDVAATGPDAERWLDIAQAFAGPPGPGRPPRT